MYLVVWIQCFPSTRLIAILRLNNPTCHYILLITRGRRDIFILFPRALARNETQEAVAERTSYFCLVRKLIWPLGSTHIFTQRGWLILFNPDYFPGRHHIGESPPNTLFFRTFSNRTDVYTVRSLHSSSITTPWGNPSNLWTSWVYSQGFPFEYELEVFNLQHTGTLLSCLQLWLCRLRRKISLRHPATSSLGRHASLPR